MRFPRASGILLHPTSLPGPTGIGELGPQLFRFLDFLEAAGQRLWQVLPLGPTGYGASPYGCYSAFAGNPMMISLEQLVQDGLLEAEELEPAAAFPTDRVDFEAVEKFKDGLLNRAFQTFRTGGSADARNAFRSWCESGPVSIWLEDYALFMALKRVQGGKPWLEWEAGLAYRDPGTLRKVIPQIEEEIWYQRFLQWTFERQWNAVRRYAADKGIDIVGDIPIYVTDDSSDVWSNPELFYLDEAGRMTVVAGVPPDYFSKTGQLWGSPLYRWDRLERTGFAWWIARFRSTLTRVDRIRLDHFRGFEAYWEVPAGDKTAEFGRWVPGPGVKLFQAVRNALGELPILAEDLGVITPGVEALRDAFEFPGMKILQFAFGSGPGNAYLPHNYAQNTVVYTGTHDNDTTPGWLAGLTPEALTEVAEYCGMEGVGGSAASKSTRADVAGAKPAKKSATKGRKGSAEGAAEGGAEGATTGEKAPADPALIWALIRQAEASVSDTCILPLQDLLELGSASRMNTPGEAAGNWGWRFQEGALTDALAERMKGLAKRYGRLEPAKKA